MGSFSDMRDEATDIGAGAFEILQSHITEFNYPVCYDFPISHGLLNYPIKQGAEYHLNIQTHQVILKEV